MRVVRFHVFLVAALLMACSAFSASTTINNPCKWAWSESEGWINCRGNVTNGAVIGEFYCSGYFWSEAVGWVHLGNGSPTNGYHYTNNGTNDYGVNHDGKGNLSGYAWCESTGWINFETSGATRVDLKTGVINGAAWGGSLGWITFSNAQAFTKTDSITNGPDNDADGIPDPWEISQTGSTNQLGGATTNDWDDDGVPDCDEYVAGTDAMDPDDVFRTTGVLMTNGADIALTWLCEATRLYTVEENDDLTDPDGWTTNIAAGTIYTNEGSNITITIPNGGATQNYYRIKAMLPLSE